MNDPVVTLHFPAEPEMVMLARAACTALASSSGWVTGPRVDDLRLAVSEAVTNAVAAQRRADPALLLWLEVRSTDVELSVVVTDSAGGFDPGGAGKELGPSTREHGRGLAIMRRFVDDLRFSQTSAGTVVELRLLRYG